MGNEFDAEEFGKMKARVEYLEDQVSEMGRDIKTLLALANQGKGGIAVMMTVGTIIGAIIGFVAERLFKG